MAEALAGRAAKHEVDRQFAPQGRVYACRIEVHDGPAQRDGERKVLGVYGDVVSVHIDAEDDVKTRLLEAERHATGAAEQIDGHGPHPGVLASFEHG
jgi:hypothetical protein